MQSGLFPGDEVVAEVALSPARDVGGTFVEGADRQEGVVWETATPFPQQFPTLPVRWATPGWLLGLPVRSWNFSAIRTSCPAGESAHAKANGLRPGRL